MTSISTLSILSILKTYNPQQTLFFLHLPKCGGTTFHRIFQHWFSPRFFLHKDSWPQDRQPQIFPRTPHGIVFGHFSRPLGKSIEQCYPWAQQFITTVREPFDAAVSHYFFLKHTKQEWFDKPSLPKSLRAGLEKDLMEEAHPYFFPYLPLRGPEETLEKYVEKFLFIGVLEKFEMSITCLAFLLDQPIPRVEKMNVSQYSEPVPEDLRKEFRKMFRDEYKFYELATKRLLHPRKLLT